MNAKWIKGMVRTIPVIGLFTAGCTTPIIPSPGHSIALPENGAAVITAQNKFAFRLFREALLKDKTSSNKLISPLSIYLDLSMVYNGAGGNTLDSMQQVLQLGNINANLLNQTNQALIAGLPEEDPSIVFNIANSIWYRNQGLQPLASFLKINSTYYQAEVAGADFGSPATIDRINNWVASQTHQKIKTIIKQINASDVMCLVNAVYFKGQWKYSFDSKQTGNKAFYLTENNAIQTPFMQLEDTFHYAGSDSLQLIELPYGKGDFNMYILLPAAGISLPRFISNLNEENLQEYLTALRSTDVKLSLPKWKYSYVIDSLLPLLNNLGMGIASLPRAADFSNMYPPEAHAYISKAVHKTYIEVNEQGTEAAAATSIGVVLPTDIAPETSPVMEVNHPFMYLITEKNSGAILFLGEVNNPGLGNNGE